MSPRRSVRAIDVSVCVAGLLVACGAGCRPPRPPHVGDDAPRDGPLTVTDRGVVPRVPDDPVLRRGFEAWAVLCAPCHGSTGKGDGSVASLLEVAPGDLTDRDALVFTTDHARKRLIAEGLEGSPMIGWKDVLGDEEIEAVDAYLRYLQERGGAAP